MSSTPRILSQHHDPPPQDPESISNIYHRPLLESNVIVSSHPMLCPFLCKNFLSISTIRSLKPALESCKAPQTDRYSSIVLHAHSFRMLRGTFLTFSVFLSSKHYCHTLTSNHHHRHHQSLHPMVATSRSQCPLSKPHPDLSLTHYFPVQCPSSLPNTVSFHVPHNLTAPR